MKQISFVAILIILFFFQTNGSSDLVHDQAGERIDKLNQFYQEEIELLNRLFWGFIFVSILTAIFKSMEYRSTNFVSIILFIVLVGLCCRIFVQFFKLSEISNKKNELVELLE
jgi:hypothetical protein